MAEAKLDLVDGGGGSAQKAVDGLTKKVADLTEKIRTMNKEGTKGAKESLDGLKNQIRSLEQTATAYVGVGAAVGIVTTAYSAMMTEMKAAGDLHKKTTAQMMADAVRAGNVFNLPKIEAFSKSGGGTPEQLLAAFRGVQKEAPTSGIAAQLALAKQVGRLSPAFGPSELEGFGALTGQVADIFPADAPADQVDAGLLFMQRAGGDISKFGGDKFQAAIKSLRAAGLSPESAGGYGLAALESNLPATVLSQVADLVAAPAESLASSKRGKLSPEEAAKMRLSKMSGVDRLAALQSDPQLAQDALGKDALKFSMLSPALIAQGTEAMRGRLTRDVVGDSLSGLRGSMAGASSEAEFSVAMEEASAAERLGPRAAATDRARRLIRANVADKGIFSRMDAGLSIRTHDVLSSIPGYVGEPGQKMVAEATARGHLTQEQAAGYRRSEELIAENNRLLAEQNQLMRGSGGGRVNVDAHNE